MAVSGNEIKIKTLYAKRDILFSRIQSISDHIKNINVEAVWETFLNEIETVDSLRTDYERILDQINHLELQIDPKYIVNYQPLLAFEDMLCRVKRTAKHLQSPSQNEAKPEIQVRPRDSIRLPPIDIPVFNGDIKTWPFFFSSFQNNIHNNPSLSDAEKLYYLISKLSGRAQSICSGFTPTANNYLLIFETLKTKYEDRRMLASQYLNQIFDLKPISSANINGLEQFLDKFVASVAALKNLKFNDLMDVVFLHIALKKLDPDTVRAFEMEHRSSEMPSFHSLASFVRDQMK
ncbi:unnamed protein product [Parnassius apollo]|uniref:(apollo) hypothetical protein n=1 Tax=Parnassius apollo TaxID=110799 RepID=A0A8S3XEL2_PARAO|nr:unnamed protein product [Parnassius apollo]